MRGQAAAVSRLSARAPGECAVSAVTAYELFTGVAKCREPGREHGKVMRLLSVVHVLPFDDEMLLAGYAPALGLDYGHLGSKTLPCFQCFASSEG